MNISLTLEQQEFIQEQLKSGRYINASEVIAQALRLLEEEERHYQTWVEETRRKVAVGIEQADRGQLTDGKVAIATLQQKLLNQASKS